MKQFINIKNLSRFLFTFFFILLILFGYTLYLEIAAFSFVYPKSYTQVEILKALYESLSLAIPIGASAIAFLTLALTAQRTNLISEQLEVSQKQIELIEKQREASYQPDLIIKPRVLYVMSNRSQGNKFILSVSSQTSKIEAPICSLLNIGRGVAKNVSYKFSYDLDYCIRIINELDSDNLININNVKSSFSIKSDKLNLKDYVHISDHNLDERSFDYILTLDLNEKWDDLIIPRNYVLLNFLKDALHISKKQPDDQWIRTNIDDRFPALMGYFSYKDLGLKERTKTFSIKFVASPIFQQPYDSQYQMKILNHKYDCVVKEI